MRKSAHNIVGKIQDSNQWYIVNALWKNADILTEAQARDYLDNEIPHGEEWHTKHYVVNPEEEASQLRQRYLDFIDDRETDEVQLFFVPWYTCNFSCSYCYQDSYDNTPTRLTTEVIDAFFSQISVQFKNRRTYLTLFGGEPLLATAESKRLITYFLEKATRENLDCAIVTNGYTLAWYVDTLRVFKIREVQVTLDGPAGVHDHRRPLKGGGKSFEAIVTGIDKCIEAGITVNLRIVLDKENMHTLPALASLAVEKGWTKHPGFKTQLGRNYELHHCQAGNQHLYSRIEMFEALYTLIQANPLVMELHKPAFSISRFLMEHGDFPGALFDSCPGAINEWAFDYLGNIYPCTASVGKQGEELGTFYPRVELYIKIIEQWQDRDVMSIGACSDCSVRLACGGGCAMVAKNKHGKIDAPDCRPVAQLLALGLSLYGGNDIRNQYDTR
jgi:uncharacterized protein